MKSRTVSTKHVFRLLSKRYSPEEIEKVTGVNKDTVEWLISEFWDIDADLPEFVEATDD